MVSSCVVRGSLQGRKKRKKRKGSRCEESDKIYDLQISIRSERSITVTVSGFRKCPGIIRNKIVQIGNKATLVARGRGQLSSPVTWD